MSIQEIAAPALPANFISFSYDRALRSLIGSWSADVIFPTGSTPSLADAFSVDGVMTGGIITEATKQGDVIKADGTNGGTRWSLAGYDAGFRLMKSPLYAHQIKSSTLDGVLKEIIEACGLQCDITFDGAIDADARYFVSGQTAANVVLDLALIGGSVACITAGGVVKIAPPVPCGEFPLRNLSMGDIEAKSLDTDGYASGVVVTLGRRGKAIADSGSSGSGNEGGASNNYGNLWRESYSGSSYIPGGLIIWRYVIIKPLDLIEEYSATLTFYTGGVYKTIVSKYDYNIEASTMRTGNTENVVWKYCLTSAESVEESTLKAQYYDKAAGGTTSLTIHHVVEHEIQREYDSDKTHITKETTNTRSYDPDTPPKEAFTQRSERAWVWNDNDGYRGLTERTWSYKDMDVGQADVVKDPDTGKPLKITGNDGTEYDLLLPANQTTTRVKVEQNSQTDEIFDDEGNCVTRIERSTNDNGLADMIERGLYGDIYDPDNSEARAAITQLKNLMQSGELHVQQYPGSSSISTEVSTMSQSGEHIYSTGNSEADTATRYSETAAADTEKCPFLCSDGTCGVIKTPTSAEYLSDEDTLANAGVESAWSGSGTYTESTATGSPCGYYEGGATPGYTSCPKFSAMKYLTESTSGTNPTTPAIGIAGGGSIWTEKEFYFNEEMTDEKARIIAQKIAENILRVKSASRGTLQTVKVPIRISVNPDGGIVAVNHDFESFTTSITYRPTEGTPPEYIMLLTTGSAALNVFDSQAVAKGRMVYGRVIDVRPDRALVLVGGKPITCTSQIRIKRADNVLIFMPPGSTSSGVVQAVM